MTWNKAAMQWANYRAPKPRVMHGTVGDGDVVTRHVDSKCMQCGYNVCAQNPRTCPPLHAIRAADFGPQYDANGSPVHVFVPMCHPVPLSFAEVMARVHAGILGRSADREAAEAQGYRDLLLHGITFGE